MLKMLSAFLAVLLTTMPWLQGTQAQPPSPLETTSSLGDYPYEVLLEGVDRYILPLMPFWYEELDPHIDEPTLTAHHMGEHNVYKSFMNMKLKEWREEEPDNAFAKSSILNIVQNLDKVPEKYRTVLRNYGGGFVNHCFYFGVLSPNDESAERTPTGPLLDDINEAFGGVEELKKRFNEEAKYLFGAGYVWLSRKPGGKRPNLVISTTKDQDSPVMEGNHPILALDLWEHAYYLKNNYRRWDHLKDFWMVVDWEAVARLDAWWVNLEAEQKKADDRVDEVRQSLEERRRFKEEKEAEDDKKQEL